MKLSAKIGIQGATWGELARFATAVDGHESYSVLWVNDHLYNPWFPSHTDDPGTFEAYTTLAALAVETDRVELGAMVGANLLRHPALVARMAATIDHISHGRFLLGLGAGWHVREHEDFGIDLLPPGRRIDALDEAIRVIRSLLSEPSTSFTGDHYRVTDARSEPKPLRRVPVVIGGAGERRTLRVVAEHADVWNYDGRDPDVLAHKLSVLREHCAAVGRDPGEIEVSVQYWPQRQPDVDLGDIAAGFEQAGAHHLVLAFRDLDEDLLATAAAALG